MSNPFKAIGKVFKKVVKVVKKIALPALAIGAAVLTGGAALGILPSIGVLGAKVGLSAGLSAILSTAGQSALIGAGGALLMGKNPIKGATMGFVTGGVLGGLGVMNNPLGIENMAKGMNPGGLVSDTLANASKNVAAINAAGPELASQAANSTLGLGAMANGAAGVAGSATPTIAGAATMPTVASSPVTTATTAARTAPTGLGGFVERNPFLAAQMVQGLGSGLQAGAEAKQRTKEQKRREANYRDYSGLFERGDWPNQFAANDAPRNYRWAIDRVTGQPYKEYVA